MAAKLKVFVTSDGLTDYVVATTSRSKALAAWGSHQDLFKTGLARETNDPALATAARAQPGEVLRRAAGPRVALAKMKMPRRPKAETPAGPSKAQLRRIADLEERLAMLEEDHESALADLEEKREALEARYTRERARLEAELSAARRGPG